MSKEIKCWFKENEDGDAVLVRESDTGLKYLIFDDELISYGRVGKEKGESESIHFDKTNGLSIIKEWQNG